jgi:hypothetical protein
MSRVIRPIEYKPSVIAGSTRWAGPPLPEVGKRRQWRENSKMSTMPTQNTGIDCPVSAPEVASTSQIVSRRWALRTPAGSATARVTTIAANASVAVAGMRSSTRGKAGWRYLSDCPKSP